MSLSVSSGAVLTRKLITAFLVGFAAYGIPRLLDALDTVNATGNYHFTRSVAISFLAGAIGAALRYALAVSPININPTDRLHSIGRDKGASVTVIDDKKS